MTHPIKCPTCGSESMDACDRLGNWVDGDKRHSVVIGHDDGFGASCWEVELYCDRDRVSSSEAELMREMKCDWPGLAAVIHAAIDKAERELPCDV